MIGVTFFMFTIGTLITGVLGILIVMTIDALRKQSKKKYRHTGTFRRSRRNHLRIVRNDEHD